MATNLDYQTTLNLKKAGRYTDSYTKGLQLLIKPSGTKYWLLRFAFNGKRHEHGIGLIGHTFYPKSSIRLQSLPITISSTSNQHNKLTDYVCRYLILNDPTPRINLAASEDIRREMVKVYRETRCNKIMPIKILKV